MKEVYEYACNEGKPTYFNLGATDWIKKHANDLIDILPLFSGIIGNLDETCELASIIAGKHVKIEEAIKILCNYPNKTKYGYRFVLSTDSSNPIIAGEIMKIGNKMHREANIFRVPIKGLGVLKKFPF